MLTNSTTGTSTSGSTNPSENVWHCPTSTYDTNTSQRGVTIGMDFGTSNSCVAVWNPVKNRAKVIAHATSKKRTLPSTVLFHNSLQDYVVGYHPTDSAASTVANPALLLNDNTLQDDYLLVSFVKKYLGVSDPTKTTFKLACYVADDDSDGNGNKDVMIYCSKAQRRKQALSAVTIASYIIAELKATAESYITRKARKYFPSVWEELAAQSKGLRSYKCLNVVIGVPANYNDVQRAATVAAAQLAGFEQVYLQVESTAAAMAYGLLGVGEKTVLVVDIGGGTTDATVLHISDGRYTVRSVRGCEDCGGVYVDQLLRDYILAEVLHLELSQRSQLTTHQLAALDQICRTAKEALSTQVTVTVTIPGKLVTLSPPQSTATTYQHQHQQEQHTFDLSRDTLNQVIISLSTKVGQVVSDVLRTANNSTTSSCNSSSSNPAIGIDEVVLVGGSSRVLAFRSAIKQALQQNIVTDSASTTSTMVEFCTAIDADEAVVQGLCIQGAVFAGVQTGLLKDVLMMDMLPQAIGVLTWDIHSNSNNSHSGSSGESGVSRRFDAILAKGDRIPAKGKRRFALDSESQRRKAVSLDVYEEVEGYIPPAVYNNSQKETNKNITNENKGMVQLKDGQWYRLMGSYNVPVTCRANGGRPRGKVTHADIEMTLNSEGELYFDAIAPDDDATNQEKEETTKRADLDADDDTTVSGRDALMLGAAIALLFVLYVFVKVYLPNQAVVVRQSGATMTMENGEEL